jgi:hypothetical protein
VMFGGAHRIRDGAGKAAQIVGGFCRRKIHAKSPPSLTD